MKKILCFCLVVILIMSATMPVVNAREVVNGTCGDNVAWSLDKTGVLTISGKGAINDMYHYTEEQPWHNYSSDIQSVIIEDGVKYIGFRAFFDLPNVTSVSIPGSVVGIGSYAFGMCWKLTDVYYDGPSTQWTAINKNSNLVLEKVNIHFNENTLFQRVPFFYTETDLRVDIKPLNNPAVVVAAVMKGKKMLFTRTKNIDDYDNPEGTRVGFVIGKKFLDQATEVRVYLWDSLDTMKPLDNPKTAIMYEGRK